MAIRKLFCQDQLDSDMPLQTSFIIPSWGHVQLDDAEDRQEPCVGHASQAGKRGRNDLWVLLKGSWKLGYLRLFEYIWVWSSRTWNLDILMLKQIYRVFGVADVTIWVSVSTPGCDSRIRWALGQVQWYSSWMRSTKRTRGDAMFIAWPVEAVQLPSRL